MSKKPVEITTTTELVPRDELDTAVLFEPEVLDAVLGKVRDKVIEVERDVSTPKGRKAVASLAHAVSRVKVAIDKRGKDRVALINAGRKTSKEMLTNLRDYAREPLTEWEAAEKKRLEAERIEKEKREAAELLAAEIDQAFDDAHAEYDLREREAAVAAREAELKAKEPEPQEEQEEAPLAEPQAEKSEPEPVAEEPEPEPEKLNKRHRQIIEMEAAGALTELLMDVMTDDEARDAADTVVSFVIEGKVPHIRIDYGEVKGAETC